MKKLAVHKVTFNLEDVAKQQFTITSAYHALDIVHVAPSENNAFEIEVWFLVDHLNQTHSELAFVVLWTGEGHTHPTMRHITTFKRNNLLFHAFQTY